MPHPSTLTKPVAEQVAALFRTFSDASRVQLVFALAEQELNVGTLAHLVGISESGVSYHMRGLRQMKLVDARRDGKEVYYRLKDEHIKALFQQGVRHVQDE
jgi:DNA-binding transcriptional ArsR family regulator